MIKARQSDLTKEQHNYFSAWNSVKENATIIALLTATTVFNITGCIASHPNKSVQIIAQGENSRYSSQFLGPDSIDVILENLDGSEFTAGFGFNLDSTQYKILRKIIAQGEYADYSQIINHTINEDGRNFNNSIDQIAWLNELVVPLAVNYSDLGPTHSPNSGNQNKILEKLLTSIKGIQLRTLQTIWGKIDGGFSWTEVRLPNGRAVIVNAGYGVNNIKKSDNYAKVKIRNEDGSLEDLTQNYASEFSNIILPNESFDSDQEYYLGVLNKGSIISVDKSISEEGGVGFNNVGSVNVLYVVTKDKRWFNTEGYPMIVRNPFILKPNGSMTELGLTEKTKEEININPDNYKNAFSWFGGRNTWENYSYTLLHLSRNGWQEVGNIKLGEKGFLIEADPTNIYAFKQHKEDVDIISRPLTGTGIEY